MKCKRCARCCDDTHMELCEDDIRRLEEAGHRVEAFCAVDESGIPRLRNVQGICYFLDAKTRRCAVYRLRPTGCSIYPVNVDYNGTAFVDEFCPEGDSVSKSELTRKGKQARELIELIDREAAVRKRREGRR